jgi:uncharacterized repeat protein (TIGR03803 family)
MQSTSSEFLISSGERRTGSGHAIRSRAVSGALVLGLGYVLAARQGVGAQQDTKGKGTNLCSAGQSRDVQGNLVSTDAAMARDSTGNLYGTTFSGGITGGACSAGGCGTVFKLDPNGTKTVLYRFRGEADGAHPEAGLIRDREGNLYGVAGGDAKRGGIVFRINPAGKETVLYRFTGGTDGKDPRTGVTCDLAGTLYGAANGGSTSDFCFSGVCGVVFKLEASGKESTLYRFEGGAGGWLPNPGFAWDSAGNLFGTTLGGTTAGICPATGCGVVFKVDQTGKETVIYRFRGGADGAGPGGGLICDSAGNLYGTAGGGQTGANCMSTGCGVIFKLDPTGRQTVLHRFTGGADGANPMAGLIRDQAGNLYGTALFGGITSGECAAHRGCGVVFKVDPKGKETVIYSFTGGTDGAGPAVGLLRDSTGNLYGMTSIGGASCRTLSCGCGVVFKLDSAGKETVIYRFKGGADGENVPLPLMLE